MFFCEKCGTRLEEGTRFCPKCGASVRMDTQGSSYQSNMASGISSFNNTADSTASFHPSDIQNNKVMAIFAYLGILVLVPILGAKESKFARYHANQGLVLFLIEMGYSVLYSIFSKIIWTISYHLGFIVGLVGMISLVFLALAIIGIINVCNGRAKELPFIGSIQILK